MEISNLNYFVERIVDLSTSNQVLCEQRREFEDKIEKLEADYEEACEHKGMLMDAEFHANEHISLLKIACGKKDESIRELNELVNQRVIELTNQRVIEELEMQVDKYFRQSNTQLDLSKRLKDRIEELKQTI